MSITTIVIGVNSYTSYASVAEADAYLAVDPVRAATWTALTPDEKGAKLVSATRRLDMLYWQGVKTGGASQVNDWPRTGVVYPDGTAVSTTEVPQEVEDATILLAGTIAIDSTASQQTSTSSKAKSIKTSTSSITFFSSAARAQTLLQDESALSLITIFLAARSITVGLASNDEDETSTFEDVERWDRNRGFP